MIRSTGNHAKTVMLVAGCLLLTFGALRSAAPTTVAAVSSKPDTAIKKAMHGIHSDLKKVKLQFFQLRYIEDAKVYNNEFRYTSGLEHDSKRDGPTFLKYGCDVYVHIKYPATRQDLDQVPFEGQLISLKDGTSFALWRLVRTEPTQEGQAFADKVNQIVTARLDAMKREMEAD